MKKKITSLQRISSRSRRGHRGIALILVLACLVLLIVMVLAFLGSIGTEVKSSKFYANDTSVKLLAQSTTDLVMAEIRDATANGSLCWASQPGMIRTYDNTGAVKNYYKLYSDSTMITTSFDHTQTLVPDGSHSVNGSSVAWYNQQGVYVDLNQPVSVNGSYQYPIVDGNSSDLISYTPTDPLATTLKPIATSASVNVLGPAIASGPYAGQPQVSGFWLNNNTPVQTGSANQAPMPVMWLYVLKDGNIAVPDVDTSAASTVTFNNGSVKPSQTNPIVGRIAFWTDDETSKINVNTASDGYNSTTTTGGTYTASYADTPRVSTVFDQQMANAPAYQNEFQRYPGHPATVSLSTVLGNLSTDTNFPENVYSIMPRMAPGGSMEARNKITIGATPAALTIPSNRLYATPDEFMFQPTLSGVTRSTNSSLVTQAALQKARFFLTANSRAPDVNLFNQPRISMWPISTTNDVAHRTPYDKLISFCTTIGGQSYYFQRDPNPSGTASLGYLSPNEWSSIARNKTLLTYLATLGSSAIPGFGGNLASKYTTATGAAGNGWAGNGPATDFDQLLMEVFDYIRSTDIYDSTLASTGTFVPYNPTAPGGNNAGVVVPSYSAANGTKGFGRFPTLNSVAIQFIAVASGTNTATSTAPVQQLISSPSNYGPAVPNNEVRVQAALLLQCFDPSQGFVGIYPNATVTLTGCTVQWDAFGAPSNIFTPVSGSSGSTVTTIANTGGDYAPWGGTLGLRILTENWNYFQNFNFLSKLPTSSTASAPYPDYPVGGTMNITAGDITVQLQSGANVVQKIVVHFPGGTFPVPRMTTTPLITVPHTSGGSSGTASTYISEINFNDPGAGSPNWTYGRFDVGVNANYTSSFAWKYSISKYDTVEGVQSGSGDVRLIAARANIPSGDLFLPHPFYGNLAKTMAHNLMAVTGEAYYGATRGQLVSGAPTYNEGWVGGSAIALATPFPYNNPDSGSTYAIDTSEPDGFGSTSGVAVGVTAGGTTSWTATQPAGDFDNGTGSVRDGPYINKADEGTIQTSAGYPAYYGVGSGSPPVKSSYFSPNREIPSPVMLGSLPTAVFAEKPWQTLLFHPDPTGLHAGAKSPMDHLLLDLFTMPVVEPYAISEPLSTAGRINMNYLIVPFNYINRDTGIRAVLRNQQMLAIPNSAHGGAQLYATSVSDYKQQCGQYNPTFSHGSYRESINADETMKGFIARFNSNDIFRSPSEICTLPLVPNDINTTYSPAPTYANIATYWQNHQLTGDNSLERPYANIYPLLTTKSNTYTIHFRVQTLKQALSPTADSASWTSWREGTDVITSEYRGSQTIERYVDPNDPTLPDFAANPSPTQTLAPYYRFRVLSTKQFAP
jgi:uncharacterized protein (TIGR02600 family)